MALLLVSLIMAIVVVVGGGGEWISFYFLIGDSRIGEWRLATLVLFDTAKDLFSTLLIVSCCMVDRFFCINSFFSYLFSTGMLLDIDFSAFYCLRVLLACCCALRIYSLYKWPVWDTLVPILE